MSEKIIEWIAKDEKTHNTIPKPKPARHYLPEWYKQLPVAKKYKDPKHGIREHGRLKDCMPFLDAMTTGYIQESWQDVHVIFETDENGQYSCKVDTPIESSIMEGYRVMQAPGPAGFYPWEFNHTVPWLPKTPKGWSVIVSPVMNRFDLPWQTMYGIIDSDDFYHWHGKLPLYVKKTDIDEVLIPAGTPLYQITPFFRENWKSYAEEEFNEKKAEKRTWLYKKTFNYFYVKNMWKKKNYE